MKRNPNDPLDFIFNDPEPMSATFAHLLAAAFAAIADSKCHAHHCPRRACRKARRCQPADPRKQRAVCAMADTGGEAVAKIFLLLHFYRRLKELREGDACAPWITAELEAEARRFALPLPPRRDPFALSWNGSEPGEIADDDKTSYYLPPSSPHGW